MRRRRDAVAQLAEDLPIQLAENAACFTYAPRQRDAGEAALFDLVVDLGEASDIADANGQTLDGLLGRLQKAVPRSGDPLDAVPIDAALRERLESLGYLE
jgi:hypothetical protein